jgi:hypothetical protein
MTATTTAATITTRSMRQDDSFQQVQVMQIQDKDDNLMKNDPSDGTDRTSSDSEMSCLTMTGGSSSTLRVTMLEDSLSQLDISPCSKQHQQQQNDNNNDSNNDNDNDTDITGDDHSSSFMDKSQKSVTFADVKVREYPICLGDNPGVMVGAPLSLSWEFQYEGQLSLDDYETSRPDRRRSDELRIPSFVRETMLKNSGYSRTEIQRGVRDVNVAKNRRKRTNETYRLHGAQEVAERLVRGTLNATVRRTKKKQERELLDHLRKTGVTATSANNATTAGRTTAPRRSTWHATNSVA